MYKNIFNARYRICGIWNNFRIFRLGLLHKLNEIDRFELDFSLVCTNFFNRAYNWIEL